MGRITTVIWILTLAGATLAGLQAGPGWGENPWIAPALIVSWVITLAALVRSPLQELLAAPLRALRARPIHYWFLILLYICLALGTWIVPYQPTNGRPLVPAEFCYLLLAFWLLLFVIVYRMDAPQARLMGERVSQSRLAGVLVTLTTLVVIFWLAEGYLRIYYITTDAYGFTAMNYHWYNNFYWGHYNSLGYRDHEPKPDDPANPLTRVAVVGDSFAIGHGINNVDDSFPQLLEQQLGAGYDVNLVAQSGWDTDVEEAYLNAYPLHPNIVVLSYYLNDIDYLLQDPAINPDNNFEFPKDERLYWFVLNFFLPNYIYYNLLQFTSPARATSFIDDLVSPYLDDAIWTQQAEKLSSLARWSRDHDTRLIILLWPAIASIEQSQPAVQRVKDFFTGQGIEVVDMSDPLRGQNTLDMILNRFDTHPSIAAHRLAAAQLYQAITGGA